MSRTKEAFFREHYAYAREAGLSDVQARLAVSQAAVETGWGTKGLAVKGNNYHGMKVGDDWDGPSISLPTREETKKGKSYTIDADFRQYASPVESYRDWASKMATNWPGVMRATTFDEAVKALDRGVKGVYATAKSYPANLKSVNSDLESSGIPAEFEAPQTAASGLLGGYKLGEETTSVGLPGRALADLVPSRTVQTTRVGGVLPGPSPMGGGLLDVADVRSITNAGVLDTLHPAFRDRAQAFFSEAQRRGINIAPVAQTGGYRSRAQQAAIGSTGVIAASPGSSFHNYGLGFDYAPIDARNRPVWDKQDPRWAQARALAEEMGMVQPIAGDLGHVQLANFPTRVPGSLKTAPTFEEGGVSYPSLDPTTQLDVAGGYGPYAHHYEESLAAAPLGAVERAPLPDVTPTRVAEQLSPVQRSALPPIASEQATQSGLLSPERVQPSLAGLLSPVSSAQAAERTPYDTVSPLQTTDRVVGVEPSSFLARPDLPGLLGAAPVGPVERAPLTRDDVADLYNAETQRLSPLGPTGTQYHNPVHQALQPTAPVGTNSVLSHNPVHQSLQPLQPEKLSPLSPERVVGQEVGGLLALGPPELTAQGLLGTPATLSQQTAQLAQQQQPAFAPTIAPPNAPSQTTIAPPGIDEAMPSAGTTSTLDNFPAAPEKPSIKDQMAPAMKRAALGLLVGGVPGAAVGLATGLLGQQGGLRGLLGGQPGLSPYGVGSGLAGMSAAIGGPRGAQGFSRSNPGMSFTSLGPNQGGLRRSEKYGWTEVVGPGGEVRGITYDDPEGGGLLGSLSRGVSGLLGGGRMSDKERGKYAGKAGLY